MQWWVGGLAGYLVLLVDVDPLLHKPLYDLCVALPGSPVYRTVPLQVHLAQARARPSQHLQHFQPATGAVRVSGINTRPKMILEKCIELLLVQLVSHLSLYSKEKYVCRGNAVAIKVLKEFLLEFN